MHGLNFVTSQTALTDVVTGYYQPAVVLVSILLASLAAYTALSQLTLIQSRRTVLGRALWYSLGAITLGAGVWSMHFTGMLAYELPVPIGYHVGLTLISMLPAGFAGLVMLRLIHRPRPSRAQVLLAGTLMGLGVGAMHYIGMAAMQMPLQMLYDPLLFVLSILVAVTLAVTALYARYWFNARLEHPHLAQLASALVMGLAVSGMHYTGMAATVYQNGPGMTFDGPVFSEGPLAIIAVIMATVLVVLATLTTFMLQRVVSLHAVVAESEDKASALAYRLKTITDRVPGLVYQFERSPDGTYRFPYASQAIHDLYRVAPEDVHATAEPILALIHPDDLPRVLSGVESSSENLTPWSSNYRILFGESGTGEIRWIMGNALPEPTPDGGVLWNGFMMDVTEQKEREAQIHRLSHYDSLTKLPNRKSLLDFLQQVSTRLATPSSGPDREVVAVIQLDLDGFRRFRDTEGQAAADRKLHQVARVVADRRRKDDLVARLGDSEFVLVWRHLGPTDEQARTEVDRRMSNLRDRVAFSMDHPLYPNSISAGVTLFSQTAASGDQLLQQASQAVTLAHSSGFGSTVFFDPETQAIISERLNLERELRQALLQDDLLLHLQPQVNQTGRIIGAEALLRWQHRERGMVRPDLFIGLAEETGLIIEIGDWVLQQAAGILKRWQHDPRQRNWTLSVNVSPRQFRQNDFVSSLTHLVQSYGVPASRLKIEITESLALDNMESTLATIEALRAIGIRFSMDDFGTGYSSLSYLSRLPFHEVKIDKSFIQSAQEGTISREWLIVQSVINLTRGLGMSVVAEGVETLEQRDRLRANGCQIYQGYYFSRPVPVDELTPAYVMNES